MANTDTNVERFAHDVCVHVLEKFGIFKAPDDTRKQNKYISNDFLPCISRSVVSYSILIRDSFKNVLEDKYKTANPTDKSKMWNFFDDYLLQNDMFVGRDVAGKVCVSLALCTEYIQFVNTKDFTVSLNKLVIKWSDFFEKNLRAMFEVEGGFLMMHFNLKSSRVDELDNFHKAFISEHCLPYGSKECITELVKKSAKKHGISLNVIFDIKTTDIIKDSSVEISQEQSETRRTEESQGNICVSEKPKPEKNGSDSEDSSSNTDTSEKTDSESSKNIESEASESEMLQNSLLGIPPHEEILREIDPFFVENIPSPPKPGSFSKSLQRQPGSSDVPRSSSKSPERQPFSSDASRSSSKSPERKPCSNDNPQLPPEQKEFQEKVEQILSKLEHDMEALRCLLYEHGLLSMKSGRRGSRMRMKDTKNKTSPLGPEDLI